MKILITGINGFIGQHLAKALISKGHFVVGLDRSDNPLVKIDKYFSGDVLDYDKVKSALQGSEAVVHLAALTAHKDIVDNRFEALEINFLGTKNVLDAFSKSETANKFIYSSTGKVYGDIKFLPITEEHPTAPLNILGKSKLITEKLIDFYAYRKKFIVFRFFNIYGSGQRDNFLIPTILNQAKKSNKIILGDIKAKRDYTYIDDAVSAIVLGLEKKVDAGFSVFNVCSAKGVSAKEIVNKVRKIKNQPIEIDIDRNLFRKDEKNIEYGSHDKIKKELGWFPEYSLEDGLKELCKQ